MSKQASKTVIGAFVLGAITLVVAGVLVFGSGKFLRETTKNVLYFEGSVKGLNVGAPVMFRGVKIGSVTDIILLYDPSDLSVYIPVIIEIDRARFTNITGKMKRQADSNLLIEKGLKAQLQMQSFVTGQLMVDLDFYPDEPVKVVGEGDIKYDEIPTIPSGLQKLTKTIEQLPLDEIFNKIVKTVDGIERLVNSPDLKESVASLRRALDSADKLLVHLDSKVDPLIASIEDTSDAARGAFVQAEKTLALDEGVPGELATSLKGTLTSAQDTLASASDALKEAKKTLAAYKGIVSEDSDLIYEVNTAMRQLSDAARSIRYFVDYIDRHPEALLRGKK
jgi:paraquat-inducible protein B